MPERGSEVSTVDLASYSKTPGVVFTEKAWEVPATGLTECSKQCEASGAKCESFSYSADAATGVYYCELSPTQFYYDFQWDSYSAVRGGDPYSPCLELLARCAETICACLQGERAGRYSMASRGSHRGNSININRFWIVESSVGEVTVSVKSLYCDACFQVTLYVFLDAKCTSFTYRKLDHLCLITKGGEAVPAAPAVDAGTVGESGSLTLL